MAIAAGLVGLPNVGKSTLFNALTKSSVPAENYPFCTIEPHTAVTAVPDERAIKLQKIYNSKKIVSSTVQFVDIAGLVKGAASGEGLGNQFLSHIREVDLILHVLRCFADPLITSTQSEIDPLSDYEIITTELILKDIDSITKRKQKLEQSIKSAKNKPAELKELVLESELIDKLSAALESQQVSTIQRLVAESTIKTIPLLSAKNFIIIANIGESEVENENYTQNPHYQKLVATFGLEKVIPISAKFEYELAQLNETESEEIACMMGLKRRGLEVIIEKSYKNLGLITFFTCGPQEIHAWPIKKNRKIRAAAGEIHSDLERGFICAEVFNCQDIFAYPSEAKLKDLGKIRTEGQDYIVQDGDIVHIKFNV